MQPEIAGTSLSCANATRPHDTEFTLARKWASLLVTTGRFAFIQDHVVDVAGGTDEERSMTHDAWLWLFLV